MAYLDQTKSNQQQMVIDAQNRARGGGTSDGPPRALGVDKKKKETPPRREERHEPPSGIPAGWVDSENGWVPPEATTNLGKPVAQPPAPGLPTPAPAPGPQPAQASVTVPGITPPDLGPAPTINPSVPVPGINSPAPVTTPTYQTYSFGGPKSIGGPGPAEMISPQTVGQYRAGSIDQFTAPSAPSASQTLATKLAGAPTPIVDQFAASGPSASQQQATQLAGRDIPTVDRFAPTSTDGTFGSAEEILQSILGRAGQNTAGLKESQKESLNAIRQQQEEGLLANAARRGTLRGGETAAAQGDLSDQFAGNLTRSYRDIDQAAAEQDIANRFGVASGLSALGSAKGSEGRANYSTGLQGTQLEGDLLNQKISQLLGVSDAEASNRREDYTTGLQGKQLEGDLLNQKIGQLLGVDEAASGQRRADYATGLQGRLAQEGLGQAEAASGQQAAEYGLNRDQLSATIQNLLFGQAKDQAGLDLSRETAQAGENARANDFGLRATDVGFRNNEQRLASDVAGVNRARTVSDMGRADLDQFQNAMLNRGQLQLAGDVAGVNRAKTVSDIGLGERNQGLSEELGRGNLTLAQKIAADNAANAGRGLDINEKQGNASMEIQKMLGLGNLSLGSLNSNRQNSQYYAGLNQNNQQFGQDLNLRGDVAANGANNDAFSLILRALGL